MRSIDTIQDTSGCRDGPQDCLGQNEWQNNLQKSVFGRQVTDLGPPVNCQPSHWREGS